MNKKMLRKVLSMFIVLCLTLPLGACGGAAKNESVAASTSTQAEVATSTVATGSTDPTKLSGSIDALLWLSSYPKAADQMIQAFNQKYPDIKVNMQMMSGNTTSENLEPRIAAGNMPDVCSVDIGEWYYNNADKGFFQDLGDTDSWKNQNATVQKQWTSPKGVKYGVSYGVCTTFMFYNKDLFKKAGITKIPENWDEFLATCEQLKKAGITPLSWPGGFANMFSHTFISYGIANNIYANDQNLTNKVLTTDYDYSTPEWTDIFQKNLDLVEKGYVNKGYMSTDFAESVRLFTANKVAMTFQGSWSCGDLLKSDNVDMFIPPWNAKGKQPVGVMAGETGFGMGKSSNVNTECAKAFFDFISFENYAKFQNFTGSIPVYSSDIVPGTKVDPRLQTVFSKLSALPLNCPLAFQILPAPINSAIMQLGQDELTGSKKPADIGTICNPIQKQYIASKK